MRDATPVLQRLAAPARRCWPAQPACREHPDEAPWHISIPLRLEARRRGPYEAQCASTVMRRIMRPSGILLRASLPPAPPQLRVKSAVR